MQQNVAFLLHIKMENEKKTEPSLRIPEDLKEKLVPLAKKHGLSWGNFVRYILSMHIQKENEA